MTAFDFSLSATVLQHLTGWPIEAAIVAVATITVVYTFVGGMKAVIWTDVIQFSVYIIGAVVALTILVNRLPGGWAELVHTAAEGHKFRLFDFSFDLTREYTFWSGLIGGMVLNTATHGADQMMVQRHLAARSKGQAALALIASGFVILAQFALFLFIGVSLWVFYRSFPPTVPLVRSDEAFTYFIITYLPTGVLGLVIAAIFSAAMGTLAGSLNASASTIVNDLYRPFTGLKDERHLMKVGRAMTILWGILLMLVALGARYLKASVVANALTVASFVFGILLGLFLLGILTNACRTNCVIDRGDRRSSAQSALPSSEQSLAWPWFALVGSFTVFAVGLAASFIAPGQSAARAEESLR